MRGGIDALGALVVAALRDTSATKATMPFVEDNLLRAQNLMGPDIWSYGLAPNAHVIEKFLTCHHDQGLSPRQVVLAELFHPASVGGHGF